MNVGILTLTIVGMACADPGGLSTDNLDYFVRNLELRRKACGPGAVWYCLKVFGMDADRQQLCREAELGPDGTNLSTLLKLCESKGLNPSAIHSADKRIDELPVPSIIVVDSSHCVVYLGLEQDGETTRYFDPGTDRVLTSTRSKVEQNWTGEAIVFAPRVISRTSYYLIAGLASGFVFLSGVFCRNLIACAKRRTVESSDVRAPTDQPQDG